MSIFERYAPLVQEYIYNHAWVGLRNVQEEAGKALFDSEKNLLICSSTASGKTEAAFFPIISDLLNRSAEGFAVLYIAPLKSLINDQFERLSDLLRMSEIPVYHWHGDAGASHKEHALKEPKGILQITPESLESMLINRNNDLPRLFSGLRYIVIDELHSLMGSDRGRQILCQILRLERTLGVSPRRIGLSATIGDKKAAADFLSKGSDRGILCTESNEERPTWRLGVEQFYIQNNEIAEGDEGRTVTVSTYDGTLLSDSLENQKKEKIPYDPGYEYIYRCTRNKSCIVFSNSREETESVTSALRQIANKKGEEDRFLIHHGNLSAAIREEAEEKLKRADEKYTACATVTLELGIDIGRLERIIQVDAPNSVSSFLQRLGRSGRRNAPPEMMMVIREEEPLPNASLAKIMPWRLLQAIAVIELYLDEKFIEGAYERKMPLSLLFQETLSILMSKGELTPAKLAKQVLTLPPFENVAKEDYKTLLRSMIEEDYLSLTEEGGLIVGLEGERLTSSFKFYASFKDSEDFTVRFGSEEIGTISSAPPMGDRFALAGHVWEVEECDIKRKLIYVHPVKGRMEAAWPGDYGEIHTKILLKMREILSVEKEYPYLKENARKRLEDARTLAKNTGLCHRPVIRLGGFSYCFFPWLGTKSCRTLRRLMGRFSSKLGISSIEYDGCYYISFKMEGTNEEELCKRLLEKVEEQGNLTEMDLVSEGEAPVSDKYDAYLPPSLLRKAYATDRLDLEETISRLKELSLARDL